MTDPSFRPVADWLRAATVDAYETYAGSFPLYQEASAYLAEAMDLRLGHDVLDVGCGTGFAAVEASRRVGAGGTVFGLDSSPAMLARARVRLPSAHWICCSAEDLDVLRCPIDRIVCNMAIWQFDQGRAFAGFRRRLTRSGLIGFTVGSRIAKKMTRIAIKVVEDEWTSACASGGFEVVELSHRYKHESALERSLWAPIVDIDPTHLEGLLGARLGGEPADWLVITTRVVARPSA